MAKLKIKLLNNNCIKLLSWLERIFRGGRDHGYDSTDVLEDIFSIAALGLSGV